MTTMVIGLEDVDQNQIAFVGGKGAQLGELSRIEGIEVPPGFCVTTEAFAGVLTATPGLTDRLDQLTALPTDDTEGTRRLSSQVRDLIERATVPDDLATQVHGALEGLGALTGSGVRRGQGERAYAVRSSATAEDLPTASFAGQHDSILNVTGLEAVLAAIRQCWASLFTERAVTYRHQHGFDHRAVRMGVVVQQMVPADAAGVLFTADPVTSRRTVTVIEAVAGLGEALVSGQVTPDSYVVRDGVVEASVRRGAGGNGSGGDGSVEDGSVGEGSDRTESVLTESQVLALERVGRRIEEHFGRPQDIEWCLVGDAVLVVQSRAITTLFPVPERADDEPHVYLSVGHQQMMTDAMKPLGLSIWQLTSPAPVVLAGGRLFVDATPRLVHPAGRANIVRLMGDSDPLMADALRTVLERGFVPLAQESAPAVAPPSPRPGATPDPPATDPAIAANLIEENETSVRELRDGIRQVGGLELFDAILEDLQELRRLLFGQRSMPVINAAMEAADWLNEHLREWLGEENAAGTLSLSAPHNVTAEMGLALLDVADVIRPHRPVVEFLRDTDSDDFLDGLAGLPGGDEAREAIGGYLESYGMRCVGEIDITRPRWSEQPSALLPVLLGHIDHAEPGEGARRFEEGRAQAQAYAEELLSRLRPLPDGEAKAQETAAMIERLRAFVGYREYPKYGMVSRYFEWKKALLAEATRLVDSGVLQEASDIFWLSFEELRMVVKTQHADWELIAARAEAFAGFELLTPPRVLTSEGEALLGAWRREDAPAGALLGLAVSSGVVEGRARVVADLAAADLEEGDILVTAFTDPSWTPAFVSIAGLVTQAGGMMTHGAVVAREYGLPAVVGVDHATALISDGQRIRLDGTSGTVEILD
ncbi:rifamycin-inactivating phosphotransferase [Ornithinimicrobium faecis]|uniref:rifamycin-inactivating phosphotransferase n=1 Tax=Ornithinimicrobium faecis TaxID=2934158 RepID=UPI002118738E|nr:rifamycin-inactivating phosphotransferase [Ornithinimicrobium sp. HY1745]